MSKHHTASDYHFNDSQLQYNSYPVYVCKQCTATDLHLQSYQKTKYATCSMIHFEAIFQKKHTATDW